MFEMQVGDTVVLNSGSILMTITNIQESIITCKWYDEVNRVFKQDTFPMTALSIAELPD